VSAPVDDPNAPVTSHRLCDAPRGRQEEDAVRWNLAPDRIPAAWFNVLPRLADPLQPPLHPATKEPVGPDDLAPLFPMALIGQEVSTAPWVDVPGPVLDVLGLWRPTPLVRAQRLEVALGTPARIYYKDESVSPAGSHKPNTAVPQAYFNKEDGTPRLTTETGAGQWGSALAFACSLFDLECMVYMVRASYGQKPYRRVMIETWGRHRRAVTGRRARPSRVARYRHQRRRP
jgi:tryptophan synthase beta chain